MRTIDLRDTPAPEDSYASVVPRGRFDVDAAVKVVAPICDDVRDRGLEALQEYSEKFDHVVPSSFRVSKSAIDKAVNGLHRDVREAIEESIRRRRLVAEQLEKEPPWQEIRLAHDARIGYRIEPVERVGLYVPGGLAPLASSVLMNVVPAQVAGVGSLAVATPPSAEYGGKPHPTTLAVCGMLGVDEVYAVGGAQAIAMFAHGVRNLCPRVDLVTGPGNIYVVAAKRYLRGVVGIDSEAGPSEILVFADDSACPDWVAADLISQAEHDPLAASVLVTDSEEFAEQVRSEIAKQLPNNPLHERLKKSLGGDQSGVVLVCDLEQGLAVVNGYAPEHLEVQTRNADQVARKVRNAGAIFVGGSSPVPLGDYSAGSTHVLPTGGAARFSSGLTCRSFTKAVHFIEYGPDGLAELSDRVQAFANAESLPGHRDAIKIRSIRPEVSND